MYRIHNQFSLINQSITTILNAKIWMNGCLLLNYATFFLARSWDLYPFNGNRLAPYYMGPKHTGKLWVYIGTPLPNRSGNTGVMVCACYFLSGKLYGSRTNES